MSTIERKRGDNYPIEAIIKVNGEPVDLTGSTMSFSFKLNEVGAEVITINGVVDTTDKSKVLFTPTVEQMSVAGQYRFDIQRVNGTIVATHLSGTMLLSDDVTI